MTTTKVREVRIRAWFREDVGTAREMLAVVYADARRRADIARLVPDSEFDPILLMVDEGMVVLDDDECLYMCEVLARIGAQVSITLWLNPEDPTPPGRVNYKHLCSSFLRGAVEAGTVRYGCYVRPEPCAVGLDDLDLTFLADGLDDGDEDPPA